MCGNDSSEVKVLVDLDRYEELIRKEEHYDNIVLAAIRGVKLSTWRDRGYDVDMDEVQYYIMTVEHEQLNCQKNMLELAQRFNDESETITIKEGEV